jgi:hypothetical protein
MIEKIGLQKWQSFLQKAGLPEDKIYRTARVYPDDEFNQLTEIATNNGSLTKDTLLHELGLEFGRQLIKTYSVMFYREWRTLDVIEKAAPIVFKIIQIADYNAPKSEVRCERISPNKVVVYYSSPRNMCPYILGIIDAMAQHFEEKIKTTHMCCQRKGDPQCEIHIDLIK